MGLRGKVMNARNRLCRERASHAVAFLTAAFTLLACGKTSSEPSAGNSSGDAGGANTGGATSGSGGATSGTGGMSTGGGSGGIAAGGNAAAGTTSQLLAVDTGTHGACAINLAGQVKCWGRNGKGQLGVGDTNDRGDDAGEMGAALPFVDLGGAPASQVAVGAEFACALLGGGTVKCWGTRTNRQLGYDWPSSDLNQAAGDEPGEMGASLRAVSFAAADVPIQIDLGARFGCALLQGGTLKCWGNYYGAGPTPEYAPLELARPVHAFALGRGHGCALHEDGGLVCFGENGYGQLGSGDNLDHAGAPFTVDLGTGITATAIAAGGNSTCAILNDGTLKCWGENTFGQLGLGDTNHRGDAPNEMGDNLQRVAVGGNGQVTDVALGTTSSTPTSSELNICARLASGQVKCWGGNTYGELGLGDTLQRGSASAQMGDALPAVDLGPSGAPKKLFGADGNACAWLASGGLVCWGEQSALLGFASSQNIGDTPGEMGTHLTPVDLGF